MYRVLKGKWTVESCKAIADPAFWCDLIIANTSRAPLSHLLNWLQKSARTPGILLDFVREKARSFADDAGKLLHDDSYHDQWEPLWGRSNDRSQYATTIIPCPGRR